MPDGFSRILHIYTGLALKSNIHRYCRIYREKQRGRPCGWTDKPAAQHRLFWDVFSAELGLLFTPVKQLPQNCTFSNNFNELQRYERRTVKLRLYGSVNISIREWDKSLGAARAVCSMQKTADGILNFNSRGMLSTILAMLFISLFETSSKIILLALQTAQFKLSFEMSIPTKYCISIMINGKSLWIFTDSCWGFIPHHHLG